MAIAYTQIGLSFGYFEIVCFSYYYFFEERTNIVNAYEIQAVVFVYLFVI